MRARASLLSTVVLASAALAGCGGSTSRNSPIVIFPDMDRQGRYEPQAESPIFGDKRASRPPVQGTVARGLLKQDNAYFTGVQNNQWIGRNPVEINREMLEFGQRRFNTYCSPCHDRTGQGRGVVAQRAIWIPTNLHEDRVKAFNDGEIFHVITNGRRSMPQYRYQIPEHDRWAIVAYVRALQRTTSGTVDDVPTELRADLR